MESAYKAGTGTEQPNLSSRFTTPIPHTPTPPPSAPARTLIIFHLTFFSLFLSLSPSLSFVLFGYTKKHENEPEMGMREWSWGAGVLCVCVCVYMNKLTTALMYI